MANPLSFLGEQSAPALPSGDFVSSGFIAPWKAAVLFTFYADRDMQASGEMTTKPDGARKQGNGFRYYFRDGAAAKLAVEPLGDSKPIINQAWYFETRLAMILGLSEEARTKFQDPMSFEVQINTMRSKKHREFQMIALPSAVAAVAKLMSYDNPGFSLAELLDQDAVFTDDFEARMVGNADAGYKDSILWQRRAALWEALGEKNIAAWQPKGTGSKFDTESDKLSVCLGVLTRVWQAPAWLRLHTVNDPRVAATYGEENKRLKVPVITEFFPDEATARKVSAEERGEEPAPTATTITAKAGAAGAAGANGTTAAPTGPAPKVPEAWAGMEGDWKATVASIKGQYAGKPLPVIKTALNGRKDELAATYAATPEEVLAWWSFA